MKIFCVRVGTRYGKQYEDYINSKLDNVIWLHEQIHPYILGQWNKLHGMTFDQDEPLLVLDIDILLMNDYMELINDTKYIFSSYYDADIPYLAAHYAKKYINYIQEIRKNLSGEHKDMFEIFTEGHSYSLKKAARIFYEIGDTQSAWITLRILKENQFLDFVRRRNFEDK